MFSSKPILKQSHDGSSHKFVFLVLLLIICLNIALHFLMLDITPYQDEGNYIVVAKWINEGDLFYKDMWNERGPVMYLFTAAIFKVFPATVVTVRLVALFFSCLQIVLLFYFSTYFIDRKWALAAPAFYLLFHPLFLGTIYRSESIDAVLILISSMFMYKSSQNKWRYIIYSGITVSLLMLDKQTGVLFFILGVLYLIQKPHMFLSTKKALLLFTFGFCVPWIFLLGYYYYHGDVLVLLNGFMSPILNYRIDQYARIPTFYEISQLLPFVILNLLFFVVLNQRDRVKSWIFALFSLICFVFMVPAFFHYQILIFLVPTSIAFACILYLLKDMQFWIISVIVPITAILIILEAIIAYQHMVDYIMPNRWQEINTTGKYIQNQTKKNDVIWVFPHESNIYLVAERKSASRHQFLLPWIATDDVLEQIINDLNRENPTYIIYSNLFRNTTHGLLLSDYAPMIDEYLINNYYIDTISKSGLVIFKRLQEDQSLTRHQEMKNKMILSINTLESIKRVY